MPPRKSTGSKAQLTFESTPMPQVGEGGAPAPSGGGDASTPSGEVNKDLEPMMSAFKMCGPRRSIAPPASDTQSNEGATFYAICPSEIPR